MTEVLKRIMELKLETENMIEKIATNYMKNAESIREQRTVDMCNVLDTIEDLYTIAKEYELTENGGSYRLETSIDSVVYPGYKVEVILYDNRPSRFNISAKKQSGHMIGWMGYSEEWCMSKSNKFPIEMGDGLTAYSKEVLNLIERWEENYQDIENGLLSDCHNVLTLAMREANKLL